MVGQDRSSNTGECCSFDDTDSHSDKHNLYPHNEDQCSLSHDGSQDDSCSDKDTQCHNKKRDSSVTIEIENRVVTSLESLEDELAANRREKKLNDNDDLPKAPDGGYGWVICCGVFMNHMIYGGLGRCDGLFFLQFQSKFGTSAQLTAWPGSLMQSLNLFMGPVCGAVVSRYSVRTAFMIGTFLCFTGMLLNGFAPNIYFLFLSQSLLGGCGRGLMSGILLLNLYFDKHRSLATGLGSSGVGAGSLWVVPLTQFLFDEYDFSGAFLILSGLCLHGFVMAMLFRPLRLHYQFMKAKLQRKKENTGCTEERKVLTEDISDIIPNNHIGNDNGNEPSIDKSALNPDKYSNIEMYSEKLFTDHEKLLQQNEINNINNTPSMGYSVTTQPNKETSMTFTNGENSFILSSVKSEVINSKSATKDHDNCCKSSLKICFPIEFKQQGTMKKKKAFHWSLLKHVPFMIFCTSNFLFILAFKTAFTFLPAIAMSKGLTKTEAALVLTISGALDTFGRIAMGFIMDYKLLRPLRPYVFNLLLFVIAAASLLIPSLTTFASFSIVSSIYGFMTGAFIAQKMVVLVDILGREMMPSSLGIQKVFQGFGTLIGPPFAGALRDALGSYDSSFYLGGVCMVGAGIILFISTLLLRIKNRKSQL